MVREVPADRAVGVVTEVLGDRRTEEVPEEDLADRHPEAEEEEADLAEVLNRRRPLRPAEAVTEDTVVMVDMADTGEEDVSADVWDVRYR